MNPATNLAEVEARLPRSMLILAALVTLGMVVSAHLRFGVGFAVGSGLGILNYLWLHQIVEALVNAGRVRPSKSALAKVFIRYPLVLVTVFSFYKLGWLPFTAILAGLFVPVGGVLCEAILLLRESWKET